MRKTHTCPKCDCRKLWHIRPVLVPNKEYADVMYPMPAATRGRLARHELGSFEHYICFDCGFTEWYALELNEALAKFQGKEGVTLVDEGPYR